MKGKLIVIEGTDCSGKETQSKKLVERLNKGNIRSEYFYFPNYDSPTGKIVGGPYLGKSYICEGWFSEGASNVDPKVASLYYAADRRYNRNIIIDTLNKGINVILDRYTYSNMGHQGGKILLKEERIKMYKWLEDLEFKMLELPSSDLRVFLHVPYTVALELKKNRVESLDQHEINKNHLIQAEIAYLEIADIYDFKTIDCTSNNTIKTIEEINEELYDYVIKYLT